MNFILSDAGHRNAFLPFTYTRPVAALRMGILTIKEKWEKHLGAVTSTLTASYLQEKFPVQITDQNVVIDASFLPNEQLVQAIQELKLGEGLTINETLIAYVTANPEVAFNPADYKQIEYGGQANRIQHTWDIFSKNDAALREDFQLLTAGRASQPISSTNTVIGDAIFLEEGAKVECSILNTTTGPIYIGKNAEVMEGCIVRGGMALGDNAILKMGAKIYGACTFGPYCKVGGEVNNAVLFAYSNKGHDGFLGNSVLGEWCNLGADTNTSNLKNNYVPVKLWDYEKEGFSQTGLQFCGLMMGDHSKAGINTMFNTGTVVGVSANVFGSGFPRNFVPSFSWGGAGGYTTYRPAKSFIAAKAMMARREAEFNPVEQAILEHVFEITKKWRRE